MRQVQTWIWLATFTAQLIHGDDALVRAAATGDEKLVRSLLQAGADPNDGRLYSMPPIAFSLMRDEPSIFEALANAGADLRQPMTLIWAAYADDTDPRVTERLLAAGASMQVKGPSGRTALAAAINSGNRAMARAALKAGLSYEPLIRDAVARAMPLIQTASLKFTDTTGCVSCHHLSLPLVTAAAAKNARIPVDEAAFGKQRDAITRPFVPLIDKLRAGTAQIVDGETGVPYAVHAAFASGWKREAVIEAMVDYIVKSQHGNGAWGTGARRPPIEGSAFTATALSARALRVYAGPDEAIARARGWLERSKPQSTEDQAMQVLGLFWSGADPGAIESAGQRLLSLQRPEGAWGETPTLESGAYSTGEALVALSVAGVVKAADETSLRGIDYLLRTQREDGSWLVRSRSAPVQPFVDSGFPHGRHQFLSTAGTCWAVMALLEHLAPIEAMR